MWARSYSSDIRVALPHVRGRKVVWRLQLVVAASDLISASPLLPNAFHCSFPAWRLLGTPLMAGTCRVPCAARATLGFGIG